MRNPFRLLLLLCLPFSSLNAAITINGDTSGAIRDLPNTGGFVVHNQGGTPITFGFTSSGGAYWSGTFDTAHSASPAFANAPTYPDFQNIDAVGATTAVMIPAGEKWFFQSTLRVRMQAGDVGAHTMNFTVWYRLAGGAAVSRAVSVPVTVTTSGSNTYTASGVHAPTGTYKYANGATVGGAGITAIWDTLVFGAVPPSGAIKVTGLAGNFEALAKIDGVLVSSKDQIPSPSTNALAPASDWNVLTTTTPADYVSKVLTVTVNGSPTYTGVIPADVNGNFDIVINASVWEYQQRINDGVTDPVPIPGDDLNTSPWLLDPDATPPAYPGVAPDTDNTVDSDGAGAGTGLSVRDVYRAVRGGVRDSLNEGSAPTFNRSEWLGSDSASGNATAGALGGGVGGGLSALTASSVPTAFGGGAIAAASPMVIGTLWGNVSMSVPSWAIWIRRIALLGLLIVFWIAVVTQIRSAFAGS